MSRTGIPSVMVTVRRMPAAADSMIASAANPAGTKMMLTSAPSSRTASATVLNTGTGFLKPYSALPLYINPPLSGVPPATTLVPYSIICWEWNVPSPPVMPWTTTRVFLSTRMLIVDARCSVVVLFDERGQPEDRRLVKMFPHDLQADRQGLCVPPPGHADARGAREVRRHGENIREVHRQRVVDLLPERESG